MSAAQSRLGRSGGAQKVPQPCACTHVTQRIAPSEKALKGISSEETEIFPTRLQTSKLRILHIQICHVTVIYEAAEFPYQLREVFHETAQQVKY